MSIELKRYDVHDDCYCDQVEDESPFGKWVRADDALDAIASAVAEELEACKAIVRSHDTGDMTREDMEVRLILVEMESRSKS